MVGPLLIILMAATATPQSSPSPVPLKTIVHVRSSAFCTTLRENIGNAIGGLLMNDQATTRTAPLFVKMANDWRTDGGTLLGMRDANKPTETDHRSAATHLDNARLEQIVGALVHNLQIVHMLLDSSHFPDPPKTDDDRALLKMKSQLEAVAKQQEQTLNILEGLVDTYDLEDLQGRGDPIGMLFGGAAGNSKVSGSNNFFDGGPLSTGLDAANPEFSTANDAYLANSPFDRFYRAVALNAKLTQQLESAAASTVVANTPLCVAPTR